jgi:hypothetical protein
MESGILTGVRTLRKEGPPDVKPPLTPMEDL